MTLRIDPRPAMRLAEPQLRLLAWLCLLVIVALAAWLRFHDIAAQSLWGDEAISWRQASNAPWGVITVTAADNYPPLHNLILHAVMACCGDVPTLETLAAVDLLRKHAPDLKIRVINVVDLMKLQPSSEHPHGLSDHDFDTLFTTDKPIIFAFHGYP